MERLIVTNESELIAIVLGAMRQYSKPEPTKVVTPTVICGVKGASFHLREHGFEISPATIYKGTMKGMVPGKRFHNKRLVFNSDELLQWAESKCKPLTSGGAVERLAENANRKMKGAASHV